MKKRNFFNEELQSRRQFFKKAAKGALPIFAAIALAGAPAIVKAMEPATYCKFGCQHGCEGCEYTCKGTCSNSCKESCSTTCRGTCSNSCKVTCYRSSR